MPKKNITKEKIFRIARKRIKTLEKLKKGSMYKVELKMINKLIKLEKEEAREVLIQNNYKIPKWLK